MQNILSPALRKLPRLDASQARGVILAAAALLTIPMGVLIYQMLPEGVDWKYAFRTAADELVHLRSPYNDPDFFSPPWALLPVIPFVFLPEKVGFTLHLLCSLVAILIVTVKLGAKPASAVAILLSYPITFGLVYGQLEWLVYLGLLLPPRWGLFFLLVKPQAGMGLVLFWLVESWRKGRLPEVIRVFAPVTAAFLLSFVLFGFWMKGGHLANVYWNASLWPKSIPVGLALLYQGLRHRKKGFAILASPFLSPYVAPHSWGIVFFGLIPYPVETVLVSAGTWIVRLMTNHLLN